MVAFGLGLALPIGIPMLFLNLLKRRHSYQLLFRRNPWTEDYANHLMMFLIAFLVIVWLSEGELEEYGLSLGSADLGWIVLSLLIGMALVGIICFPQIVRRTPFKLDYPLTSANVFGILSCEWFFAGLAEELCERGIVQSYLMKNLEGFIRVVIWEFHIGTLLTALLLGITSMVFLGEKPKDKLMHGIYVIIFAFLIGYVYQETNSLIGPILAHNIIRGLGASVRLHLSKRTFHIEP